MDGIFSGFGLAGAAGLNAYIPLLLLGIAGRAGYADLNAPYDVLSSPVGLGVLTVLLTIEVLADKVPGVDHVNDIINTVVRPAAGGALFLSSNGAGTINPVLAALLGLLVAGGVHATKATARPLVTATTGGLGNPVVSIIEDLLSLFGALLAIFAPVLVVVFLLVLCLFLALIVRRRRARRAATRGGYATG
ncbi:MAG: hypothetical protein AVDCRST_MAG18-4914 [uncultured Thermomicrobiales bacterium]|uniref:DUF4126 domain-containing protein n=1 Tax=uncultured Thermomicrobiales bacterium TaxID=1645740 RepID=A0A6J4VY55_9BACT|nr:MAG: hypothetical protein AVDCRST_MAG18-4914 [uncultured Thermomicrobiales bacterium]